MGMGYRAKSILESPKLVKSKNSNSEDGGQCISTDADTAAGNGGAPTTNSSSRGYSKVNAGSGVGDVAMVNLV